MAGKNWLAPAAAAVAIVGGLAIWRSMNLKPKAGDYVAVSPNNFATPIGLPSQLPPDSKLLVRVDSVTPQGLGGYIVGYVASPLGEVMLPTGGAAGIPVPAPIQPGWVKGVYRGMPPKLVG